MSKSIGVIGSGQVGQALALGFVKHGYSVMLGSNNPEKRKELSESLSGVTVGTFAEAAAFGSLLVLAVKGSNAIDALNSAGLHNFSGKVVLDANNPIEQVPPVDGVIQYFTQQNHSLMEQLQSAAPSAHFVKAFSCVGAPFMVNPDFGGIQPTMFICGNDTTAKTKATGILHQFGWEVEDLGTVSAAGAIESLAILWCIPGFRENRWVHAFKLLKG